MRVVAANGDREVHRWCREILGEVLGREWVLKVSDAKQELSAADLYIWDHHPGFRPPAAGESAEHFLLADRDSVHPDLPDLRLPNVNIILKPATRAITQKFSHQLAGSVQHLQTGFFGWISIHKRQQPDNCDSRIGAVDHLVSP